MSKYIDIVGIVKENKEFTLEIALYDAKREGELTRSNIIKCESFSNGLLLVDTKKDYAWFFNYKKESREMRAKRLSKFLRLDYLNNRSVLVKVDNDYSFWLDDREWRGK